MGRNAGNKWWRLHLGLRSRREKTKRRKTVRGGESGGRRKRVSFLVPSQWNFNKFGRRKSATRRRGTKYENKVTEIARGWNNSRLFSSERVTKLFSAGIKLSRVVRTCARARARASGTPQHEWTKILEEMFTREGLPALFRTEKDAG